MTAEKVESRGVLFDTSFSFTDYVSKLCCSVISRILKKYQTGDSAVNALISSHMDCCNCLFRSCLISTNENNNATRILFHRLSPNIITILGLSKSEKLFISCLLDIVVCLRWLHLSTSFSEVVILVSSVNFCSPVAVHTIQNERDHTVDFWRFLSFLHPCTNQMMMFVLLPLSPTSSKELKSRMFFQGLSTTIPASAYVTMEINHCYAHGPMNCNTTYIFLTFQSVSVKKLC